MVTVPYGDDGLLFVGGENAEVVRGRSTRTVVQRILPLLNGHHTLDEIAALPDGAGRHLLHDVVSLLFSRGLLEDGAQRGIDPPGRSELASYLGRFADVTRSNRNREEALSRLASASVSVFGVEHLVDRMLSQLHASGMDGALRGKPSSVRSDLAIIISTGERQEVEQIVPEALQGSRGAFLLRFGERTAHIGPLLSVGSTCCPRCFFRIHPHPVGSPEADYADYWTGLGALQVLHLVAKLAPSRMHREFRILSSDEEGDLHQTTCISVRTPGCPECGIPNSPLTQDDPQLLAWIYHCATSFPDRSALSPRDHQSHYSIPNIQLASEDKPSFGENALDVSLPVALPLSGPLPWTFSSAEPRPVDVSQLATILARCAGEFMESGSRRRAAPTGGNLGPIDLWVAANDVKGLERAVYRYNGARHRLEWARDLSADSPMWSSITEEPPKCLIVGTGDLARCSRKYQNFAYRLTHYDSGVALAYLHAVAASLEISTVEFADFDDERVANLLGIPTRWDFPVPTFAAALGSDVTRQATGPTQAPTQPTTTGALKPMDYSSEDLLSRMLRASSVPPLRPATVWRSSALAGDAPVTSQSLDQILRSRRAVREYASLPVSREALETIMRAAVVLSDWRSRCGSSPCFVRPVLAVARGTSALSAGLYELDGDGALVRRSDFNPEMMRECFNQSTFGDAPAAVFTVGDLGQALCERGSRGYREMSQHSGSIVGYVWLAATALGLAGTAAGGVIPAGLRIAAGMDGFRECPLLAFPFGFAATSLRTEQQVF
jgi:SagB-type dehydrogenase family enzyme